MADMHPRELAEKLSVREYISLCSKVEEKWKQKFGVKIIYRAKEGLTAIVELEDKTQHKVLIQ